ncbi:MAG: type III pantothenate kinase [Bacteroidota bacterium]
MNLAVDIGNTRTKLGLFDESQTLKQLELWSDFTFDKLLAYTTNHPVENVIFSSVGQELSPDALARFFTHINGLHLDAQTPLPIKNHYKTPETLGKDRLAAVVGAAKLYPNEYCLVIDAGTCITYDFLEAGIHYQGGNIAPGLHMRFQAMQHFTKRLPLVEPEPQEDAIGKTTKSALQNGVVKGILHEIEGYVAYCQEQYGKIRVILTGGDADFLAKQLKRKIFVHHNLVLEGLCKILDYNVKLST